MMLMVMMKSWWLNPQSSQPLYLQTQPRVMLALSGKINGRVALSGRWQCVTPHQPPSDCGFRWRRASVNLAPVWSRAKRGNVTATGKRSRWAGVRSRAAPWPVTADLSQAPRPPPTRCFSGIMPGALRQRAKREVSVRRLATLARFTHGSDAHKHGGHARTPRWAATVSSCQPAQSIHLYFTCLLSCPGSPLCRSCVTQTSLLLPMGTSQWVSTSQTSGQGQDLGNTHGESALAELVPVRVRVCTSTD